MQAWWRKQTGFTIVELLVVIVVIGTLSTVTTISYSGVQSRAIEASLQSDLNNAAKKLKMDYIINGFYPTTLATADGGKGISPGSDTTYEYAVSNSTDLPGFCVEAISRNIVYRITENNRPTAGNCDNYGLLLHLDGNDTGSYPGSGNSAFDLTGLNNNITSYDANLGFTESAFDFTATNTDGLNIQNNNFTNLKDFTFEIVFKVNGDHLHYDGTLISSGNWNNSHWSFGIGQTNSAVKTRRPYSNTPYSFSFNTWYHIVFTRLGTKYITYINGTKIVEYTVTDAIPLVSEWANTAIGRETYAGGYFNLNGKIALVKIYNRALSVEKITEDFEAIRLRYGI